MTKEEKEMQKELEALLGEGFFICELEDLQVLCQYWQKVLCLEGWKIDLSILRAKDFAVEGATGECYSSMTLGRAAIHILDPIDFDITSCVFAYDMERVLVHELLHIHMSHFEDTKPGTLEYKMMERTVDQLANAFVDVNRQSLTPKKRARKGVSKGEKASKKEA